MSCTFAIWSPLHSRRSRRKRHAWLALANPTLSGLASIAKQDWICKLATHDKICRPGVSPQRLAPRVAGY